jgi:hypothetical protein
MNVATCKMLNLPMECPNKLHTLERNKLYNLYIPFTHQQKRHPLSVNSSSNNSENMDVQDNATTTKNKRTNVCFIEPRVKHCKIQQLNQICTTSIPNTNTFISSLLINAFPFSCSLTRIINRSRLFFFDTLSSLPMSAFCSRCYMSPLFIDTIYIFIVIIVHHHPLLPSSVMIIDVAIACL